MLGWLILYNKTLSWSKSIELKKIILTWSSKSKTREGGKAVCYFLDPFPAVSIWWEKHPFIQTKRKVVWDNVGNRLTLCGYHISVNNTMWTGFCIVSFEMSSLAPVIPLDNYPSWSQSGKQLCGPLIRNSDTICLFLLPQISSNGLTAG